MTFRDDPVTYSVAASTRSPEMEIVNPPTYANFLLADFPIFRKALLENLPDKRDNRSKLSGATSVIRVKANYYAISIPRKGQDPHGVVIPSKWQWPTETTSITNAYPQFAAWAHDIKNPTYKNWYMSPEAGKVVNK